MADSPEKELVKEALQELEVEAVEEEEKGNDKSKVATLIEGVAGALPEVGEAVAEVVEAVGDSNEEQTS